MTVADRIRNLRKQQGLSQEGLARRAGYKDKTAISKLEHAEDDITLKQVKRIAKALDCTPGYLMGWTSHPNQLTLYDLNGYEGVTPDMYHDTEDAVEMTSEEYGIIQCYRKLTDSEKNMVKRMIGYTDNPN